MSVQISSAIPEFLSSGSDCKGEGHEQHDRIRAFLILNYIRWFSNQYVGHGILTGCSKWGEEKL